MSDQELHIVTPAQIDFPELVLVWESSVRASHFFLSEDDLQFYKGLVEGGYLASVDLYCIKIEGAIAGFMGIEGDFLQMLFVKSDYMGKGVGSKLLRFGLQEKGVRRLEVNEQNERAVSYYLGFGFEITGRSALDGSGRAYPVLLMEWVAKVCR